MEQDKPKRLLRSRTNRVLAGVCGGLGEYFDIDPTILRILFVALTLWGGSGVLIYIIIWLLVPESEAPAGPLDDRVKQVSQEIKAGAQKIASDIRGNQPRNFTAAAIIGAVLIIVGFSSLLQQFLPWRIFRWEFFWPVIIIVLGFSIIWRRK